MHANGLNITREAPPVKTCSEQPLPETIDQIEAGRRVSGQIRFALQVPDLQAAMERLLAHGAVLVHPPVITPWGDHNVRLQDPDGMQITLFEAGGRPEKSQ